MRVGEQRKVTSRAESLRSLELLLATFGDGPEALVTRAPGRVNLIGEHTDYNNGYVLPFAIDRTTDVAVRPRRDQKVRAVSAAFPGVVELELPVAEMAPTGRWSDYLIGVLLQLSAFLDCTRGFDMAINSTIPLASGLSSSAALEISMTLAITSLYGASLHDLEVIRLCQQAETQFVGVQCGIMDQYVSLLARDGSAMLLEVASLNHRHVPISLENASFLVINTGLRSLSQSYYNQRRTECEEALTWLRRMMRDDAPRSLSDVSPKTLEEFKDQLPAKLLRRGLHVVFENQRVLAAVKALEHGDVKGLGELLLASHTSLRELYEVSTPELDFLVEWAQAHGAFGARLVGAGFGGATLHLVPSSDKAGYGEAIGEAFVRRFGRRVSILEVCPSPGAKELLQSQTP